MDHGVEVVIKSGGWYYKDRLGRSRGPMELVQLKTAWAAGIVDTNTFIWGDDLDEWAPIGMVHGLESCVATLDMKMAAAGTNLIHKRTRDRRHIECDLFGGRLRVVAATNALELGVDVGSLDATLHLGFPGTVASLWQQAGRAIFSFVSRLPITHGVKCNDLYAFNVGCYLIWATAAAMGYAVDYLKRHNIKI